MEGLPEFLRRNVVDEVAMYLPLRSCYESASRIAVLCEQNGILMRFDGDVFGLQKAQPQIEEFGGRSYVTASTTVRDWWPLTIKRALDIFFNLGECTFLWQNSLEWAICVATVAGGEPRLQEHFSTSSENNEVPLDTAPEYS
jgi:hypothetical protein